MFKLSLNLVTWNGAKYLPVLLNSLKQQTYQDWILNVFDNHSSDETVKILKKELNSLSVQFNLLENQINVGFASAHNQLFQQVDTPYVLILNQDIQLEPDCLAKLVDFLDRTSAVAVSPRLMKWQERQIIDSFGLKVWRSRRVVERLANRTWTDFDQRVVHKLDKSKQAEVFGVSASCAMYNCQMLKKILLAGQQLFDDSYMAYKEDVDLAYRLQSAGGKSYVLLDTAAYHDRTGSGGHDLSDQQAVKNKPSQSKLVKYHSYKNHLATLYKNEYWQNFVLDWPWIVWYELKKFVYFLLFDRSVLRGWWSLWQNRAVLKEQRQLIKKARQLSWREIRRWWR